MSCPQPLSCSLLHWAADRPLPAAGVYNYHNQLTHRTVVTYDPPLCSLHEDDKDAHKGRQNSQPCSMTGMAAPRHQLWLARTSCAARHALSNTDTMLAARGVPQLVAFLNCGRGGGDARRVAGMGAGAAGMGAGRQSGRRRQDSELGCCPRLSARPIPSPAPGVGAAPLQHSTTLQCCPERALAGAGQPPALMS